MGLMATWAEQSPKEQHLRVSRARRFGRIEGEIETFDLPVGSIERAEIHLETTFLHKPFASLATWKKAMEIHGFIVEFNKETIVRNDGRVRWRVEAQVYIAERKGGAVEKIFVRTLRLESTDPKIEDLR